MFKRTLFLTMLCWLSVSPLVLADAECKAKTPLTGTAEDFEHCELESGMLHSDGAVVLTVCEAVFRSQTDELRAQKMAKIMAEGFSDSGYYDEAVTFTEIATHLKNNPGPEEGSVIFVCR